MKHNIKFIFHDNLYLTCQLSIIEWSIPHVCKTYTERNFFLINYHVFTEFKGRQPASSQSHMALKLSFKCHLIFLQINVLSTLVNKKVLENIQIQYSAYLQRGQTSAKCLIKNMNPL